MAELPALNSRQSFDSNFTSTDVRRLDTQTTEIRRLPTQNEAQLGQHKTLEKTKTSSLVPVMAAPQSLQVPHHQFADH